MHLVLHGDQRGVALRVEDRGGFLVATVCETHDISPADSSSPSFVALYREVRRLAASRPLVRPHQAANRGTP
jgi:hypothetical protein